MASLQDLKRRTKSVKNIQQITNAMEMVATSRMRHAKEAATSNIPYAEKMQKTITNIVSTVKSDFTHPLLKGESEGMRLLIVVAADKGLAGAYSSNVFKEALKSIEDKENTQIIAVGRKAEAYFKRRGYALFSEYVGFSDKPTVNDAQAIATEIIGAFQSGEYADVKMVYTRFVSAICCEPETVQLLPFVPSKEAQERIDTTEYIYEPSAEEVLGFMLPQSIFTTIYAALLQSAASELSSRMNAMSNATDNAQELIANLELHYNKVRQAKITTEINEIVGGAEALN